MNIGDKVTCKVSVPAYYSNYGINPPIIFTPGMEATVISIAPKVVITGEAPIYDKNPNMIVCDYYAPETNKIERVSLNFCNVERI